MPGNVLEKTDKTLYHYGPYLLIKGNRLCSLLECNNCLRRKKHQNGKREHRLKLRCGRKLQYCVWYLRKTLKRSLKILQKESDMNTLVPSILKPAFFIPFRYFYKCHFFDILSRFVHPSIFAQISPSHVVFLDLLI